MFSEILLFIMAFVLVLSTVAFPLFAIPLASIFKTAWERSQQPEIRLTLMTRRERFTYFLIYRQQLNYIALLSGFMIFPFWVLYDEFFKNKRFIDSLIYFPCLLFGITLIVFLILKMKHLYQFLKDNKLINFIPFFVLGLPAAFVVMLPQFDSSFKTKQFIAFLIGSILFSAFYILTLVIVILWNLPHHSKTARLPFSVKVGLMNAVLNIVMLGACAIFMVGLFDQIRWADFSEGTILEFFIYPYLGLTVAAVLKFRRNFHLLDAHDD